MGLQSWYTVQAIIRRKAIIRNENVRRMTQQSKSIPHRLLIGGFFFLTHFVFVYELQAQELYPVSLPDRSWHGEQRALRYRPEGKDFVIVNGKRRFTRALYGTNTAFRAEAGDLPEFAIYMPGMGGNLKFGLMRGSVSKWLNDADTITARYRPGSMLYEIKDKLLGTGTLELIILPLADAEGIIVKAQFKNVSNDLELCWTFGGASGKKFNRNGDMGPDPESSFYLKPEYCTDNRFNIQKNTFTLRYGSGLPVQSTSTETAKLKKEQILLGFVPAASTVQLSDATQQESPLQLAQSRAAASPVLTGWVKGNEPLYFALQNPESKAELVYANAATLFAEAEIARKKIADRIQVKTPDPYLNTVGGALSIASDAIWETPSYLHGAIGWRIRLNGWRGAYTADPLGWHDRARTHFRAYAQSQVTAPASGPSVPDTANHLARQQEKLGNAVFTSGYISRDPEGKSIRPHHYDMNLVYIDALLWHLNWTGDLTLARELWPVIQRHLAWEKRNFDPDGDGLYDAYAAIWASDALQYSGGAVTHTSAYNYRANRMAATLAKLLGEDAKPYEREAETIHRAINRVLWIPEKGVYAEFQDAMGLKKRHDVPALWTIYHAIDSDVPDAFQAYQNLRYVDTQIPHIPVRANGLKDQGFYTISTSNWMPYEWSINNVALAESAHTALANWEAGRTEEAFKLWKSELLASMYLGGSSGNFVQISHYDANRGEAYRDFGDPVGINSRTLVEGLFGIVPDALNNRLLIRPGLPKAWTYASLEIPDLLYDFKRNGLTEVYTLKPRFPKKLDLCVWVNALRDGIKQITINGKKVTWKTVPDAIGQPVIELNSPAQDSYEIRVEWTGNDFKSIPLRDTYAQGTTQTFQFPGTLIQKIFDPQGVWQNVQTKGHTLRATITSKSGSRTAFVQLKQGQLTWWHPVCFEVQERLSLVTQSQQTVFQLKNHTDQTMELQYTVQGVSAEVKLQPRGLSKPIQISMAQLHPGTNPITIQTNSGEHFSLTLTNWEAALPESSQEPVLLTPYFNDRVTQIFKNQYLSPRSQTPTLQLPTQGIGEWTHPLLMAEIDDAGLREHLAQHQHTLTLPQGIRFQSPAEGKNILFVSRWDNYPTEARLPVTGRASHAYLLLAGSTNPMQSRIENGMLEISYTDGTAERLVLRNPENWWPIEKDYLDDGFAFSTGAVHPPRVHLKTGEVVYGEKGSQYNGKEIEGGAATVLDLPLNPAKTLKELKLTALANDVVIGLMSVTLVRP